MTQDFSHILVVDDDDRLRELLRKYLSENGFLVATAPDAQDARAKLEGLTFDLIILDLMMPGENGFDFARSLRQKSTVPVLMLTAMGEAEERIRGLECGADDYLTKPFEPRELVLRINSILRRVPAAAPAPETIRMGDATFDRTHGVLARAGKRVHLTSLEQALLTVFAEAPGVILGREELIVHTAADAGGRAVDVQVTRLRRKIEDDPRAPRYLQTVRGRGYVLKPD
ncbi:response regulator [Varunaivibrio sulfuroxidans]|uniref:Winged helix family two component transcriptional regulator n=1 Tax=Varunaivibrio sulfuroxidans TaxID=1773489 RepID=A0A4R3J8N9_9PROT|nr:response regulator transcription factor [Varunaivibrio sulfuroxidans]TCS60890.1 winged helix family two component transcriptional regulator [Varunaivibrio sulfuroxidans]WES31701.1 response regulator transcription factor [Varunaivibrio sulfuroxidans]